MNCPNCGAPLRLATNQLHFECDYCSSLYIPTPTAEGVSVLGEPTGLNCPACRRELVTAHVDGTHVQHCPHCLGLLVKQAVFAELVKHLRARATTPPLTPPPLNHAELERQIVCPQCGTRMVTFPYGGPGNIVVDNCPNCLVLWLDHYELGRIIDTPGRDRRRPS